MNNLRKFNDFNKHPLHRHKLPTSTSSRPLKFSVQLISVRQLWADGLLKELQIDLAPISSRESPGLFFLKFAAYRNTPLTEWPYPCESPLFFSEPSVTSNSVTQRHSSYQSLFECRRGSHRALSRSNNLGANSCSLLESEHPKLGQTAPRFLQLRRELGIINGQ